MTGPIRAVLDISALQVDGIADRGIGRYVAAYSAALARVGRVAAALLAPELPPASGLPVDLVVADLLRWDSRAEARRLLQGPDPVVYHVMAPFLHALPGDRPSLGVAPHWAESGVPRVVTLHDLIPLRAPRHYLPTPAHEERYRARAAWVGAADLVFANSEHTRSEAIELLGCPPDQVVTVGAGVSPFFSPRDGTDDELWRFHMGALEGRSWILTVGGSDTRKGTERLILAVGRLVAKGRDIHLVVVGDLTVDWRRRLEETAGAVGLAERMVITGAIGDELLRACYRRAALTVMPSLAEGSGFPVLESAASGTPALASSTTSLAEVAATPLAVFDPTDTDAIAEVIDDVLSDEARRADILTAQQALAAASTWGAVADRASAALETLGAVLPPASWHPVPLRRRVALVGPLPPDGGGIGAYDYRLLAAMPPDVQVDAVVASRTIPELPPAVGYVAAASFGCDSRAASYDAVVYPLGNSSGQLATVELALRDPGWVWLHEVRLPAIATTALEHEDDDRFAVTLERLLVRAYPGRPPLGAARRAGRSTLDLLAAGVGLVGPLAERCRGILVNSELARRLLVFDLVPLAHHPPVHVLPPGCPPVRPRRTEAAVTRDPLVVALGVVSMAKRPDLLVDGAAAAGCQLAFVGPCPPILAQFITDRAALRGVSDRVEVIGATDDWWTWMERAALAVQLRDNISGETSAAVLDALSAGLPVLTNLASADEYPQGTVALLPSAATPVLSARIRALLGSPADLHELSRAGQAFAAEHQFDRVARALLSIVMA